MLGPFIQSTSPTPTSLNDALAGVTLAIRQVKEGDSVMWKICLLMLSSCLYSRFCKITTIQSIFMFISLFKLRLSKLNQVLSLLCPLPLEFPHHFPKKPSGTFFSGGLCVEPNPSMHKYFEVHRPSCELVKNCPLAATRKIGTRSHGPQNGSRGA